VTLELLVNLGRGIAFFAVWLLMVVWLAKLSWRLIMALTRSDEALMREWTKSRVSIFLWAAVAILLGAFTSSSVAPATAHSKEVPGQFQSEGVPGERSLSAG